LKNWKKTGRGISGHHQEIQIPGEKIGVYPISENSWMDMGSLMNGKNERRLEKDE